MRLIRVIITANRRSSYGNKNESGIYKPYRDLYQADGNKGITKKVIFKE